MRVRELIELLRKEDPEAKVRIVYPDATIPQAIPGFIPGRTAGVNGILPGVDPDQPCIALAADTYVTVRWVHGRPVASDVL
jgi:hypothetical protein